MDTDLEQAQCWNRYSLGFFGEGWCCQTIYNLNIQFAFTVEWSGQQLVPTHLYGIRIYTNGSFLNAHVDQVLLRM